MQTILEKPKFTIVKPQNSITNKNAQLFERELTIALRKNLQDSLLLDLEQVEFLDSAGLMVLISTWKLAQRLAVRFSLCSVSPSLKIIIELSQLDRIFEIFDCPEKYTETL